MFNQPNEKQLTKIPKFYETEGIPLQEKLIHLHFQFGDSHWFITEFDGKDTFFGFAILNGDLEMAEWGYISFEELKSINIIGIQVETDLAWVIKQANRVDKICMAQRWSLPEQG